MRKIENNVLRHYPIALRLDKKRILVAGGGQVAERKVLHALEASAELSVASPEATPLLKRLARKGRIRWIKRRVLRKDITGCDVVIAATNDAGVNKDVSRWAHAENALVNVVDNPGLSNFISPAVFRKKKAIVTVYTDGKDPGLSRDVKNYLKESWNDFLSYRNRLQESRHGNFKARP